MLHSMKMPQLISIVVIVTLLKSCDAELSALEKFLTSGFNNKETAETKQDEGKASEPTSEDLIKFMRRAGLISNDNQINNQQRLISSLQALNSQQQQILYLPQQSQLTNYVAPKRQLQGSQQQQQLPLAHSSSRLASDSNTQSKSEIALASQKSSDKGIIKADRQGLYAHDDVGYAGQHDGYVGAHDAYSSHQDSYSSGHYAHEPVAYHPPPPPKSAAVAIKIDPIGILRLLLQGIPKPLLNLNGKLFFGVELGKNAGIVKGVGYAPAHAPAPHYAPPAKGIVLNLG